jgi:hypothetical protein
MTSGWDKERYANDPVYRQHMKDMFKKYSKTEKGKINQYEKRQRSMARKKEVLNAFKANGCSVCSEKALCAMDVHHLDPSQKEFEIGALAGSTWAVSRLENELAKCICLCANCHRKYHAGLITL